MQPSFTARLRASEHPLARPYLLDLALVLGLIGLVIVASLPLTPALRPIGRDNGIQAYTAEVVFEGGTLYRDAWDNKLPGVYLIDALAFRLFGTDPWAIWSIDVLFLSVTVSLFYALLRLAGFSSRIAPLAAGLFVLLARHPLMLHDVNFTESYALLPQVMVFLSGYRFLKKPGIGWAVAIGLSASLAFLLKQTTVGVALALIPALILMRHPVVRAPQRWTWLAAVVGGGLLGLGVMALYLAANDVLTLALQASIAMPVAFHDWVSARPVSIFETLLRSLTRSVAPVVLLLVAGLIAPGLLAVTNHRRRGQARASSSREAAMLGGWAVLTVFTDLVLVNITNRSYAHYYVTLVPGLTVVAAIGLQRLLEPRQSWVELRRRQRLAFGVITLNLSAFALGIAIEVGITATGTVFGPPQEHPVVQYVERSTRPEDTVFVWGASSDINFEAQRHSPTQYHYSYPLIVPGYTTPEQIAELLDDLRANQPALIVDTTVEDGNRVPPLDAETRAEWLKDDGRADTTDLTPLFEFVETHCAAERTLDGVTVYRCEYGEAGTTN